MKKLFGLTLVMVLCSIVSFAIPNTITYQGKLLEGGIPANGNYSLQFAIYDAELGGTQLWPTSGYESHNVSIENGIYTAVLGSTTAINAAVFSGNSAWLEVKIQTETLPRVQIHSVPYSFQAERLSGVTPTQAGDIMRWDGAKWVAVNLKTYYRDVDNDGFGDKYQPYLGFEKPAGFAENSSDCNDGNSLINPNISEILNGIDDDCDGTIDEGVSQEICDGIDNDGDGLIDEGCGIYYLDADGDGYGDPINSRNSQASGYVMVAGDCNDANAAINPGATEICDWKDNNCDGTIDDRCVLYYRDDDGDGYGGVSSIYTNNIPNPYPSFVVNSDDCDDFNPNIHPGATELWNQKDDNCNWQIDEPDHTIYFEDLDNDGWGKLKVTKPFQMQGYVNRYGDCNDRDAAMYPGASEILNGIDDDCDGDIDEGIVVNDRDGDGYTVVQGDCNDNNASVHPGATEILNGIDDDCDGSIDQGIEIEDIDGDAVIDNIDNCPQVSNPSQEDTDGDGIGDACELREDQYPDGCTDGIDNDDDGHTDLNDVDCSGGTEACDGIDNDGDGLIDEGCETYYRDADGDGYGDINDRRTGSAEGYVMNSSDCNDGNSSINPGASEILNGIDDDCDGDIDEGIVVNDRDGDGYTVVQGDCNDNNASVHPGATEILNGIDDDCDGSIDQGIEIEDIDGDAVIDNIDNCPQVSNPAQEDSDGDGIGDACELREDQYPDGCTDGIDNDGDGLIDEGCGTYYHDADADGYGDPGHSRIGFASGYILVAGDCNDGDAAINPGATEICDGNDNDCNGEIDGIDVSCNDITKYCYNGGCVQRYALGVPCSSNNQCMSGHCCSELAIKQCTFPDECSSCDDGIRNNTETDVDCGGTSRILASGYYVWPCSRCQSGKRCGSNTDCQSINCIGGICQ